LVLMLHTPSTWRSAVHARPSVLHLLSTLARALRCCCTC
jgi:hypothetical protein